MKTYSTALLISILTTLSLQASALPRHQPTPPRPNPCGEGAHMACHNGHIIQCACVGDTPPPTGPQCPTDIEYHPGDCNSEELHNGCVSEIEPLGDGSQNQWTINCYKSHEQEAADSN